MMTSLIRTGGRSSLCCGVPLSARSRSRTSDLMSPSTVGQPSFAPVTAFSCSTSVAWTTWSAVVEDRMAWAVLLQAHKSVLDVLAAHYDWSFGVGHGVGGGNSARAPGVEHSLGRGVSASRPVCQGLSESAALRGETARRNNSVDEAPRRENLWRQDSGCKHHLSGASYADPRRDALGSARVRDASCNCLDLPDLTALCGPDQIARKARLERARVALAVDECEGRDRQILDRADQRQDRRAQLPGLGFVNTDEDRELRPCGKVITLGSQ